MAVVTLTSFLDGQQYAQTVTDTTTFPVVPNDFDLVIGAQLGFTPRFWLGGLDDIRIWNVARSAEDIAQNHNQVVAPDSEGLVLSLDFESPIPGGYVDAASGLQALSFGGVSSASGAPINGGSNAIFLDGTGYLSISDPGQSPLDLTGNYTLEAWILMDSWAGGDWNTVFDKNHSHQSTNNSYGITRLGSDNSLTLHTWADSTTESSALNSISNVKIDGIDFMSSGWHHIAFTYSINDQPIAPIPVPASSMLLLGALSILFVLARMISLSSRSAA